MAKLYPPVIEGTIPAFNGTTLVVPFSMNRAVSEADIGGFSVKVKTVQSNTFVVTLDNGILQDGYAQFDISGAWEPTPGQYYKLQLAYIDKDGVLGYYSTVGVVKYCAIDNSNVSINGLNAAERTIFRYIYTGVYEHADDPMEKVYQYRFVLYKDDEIDTDSGWVLHNAIADMATDESVDTYEFLDDLDEDATYAVQYQVITTNELHLSTPKYSVMVMPQYTGDFNITLDAILDNEAYDNGYVKLIAKSGKNVEGRFKIYRANVKQPKRWSPIFNFILQGENPENFIWRDFTVEHGETYIYKICQYNTYGIQTVGAYSNEIYVDFEDMFLFDGERQLKIQFNPKVSSFKNDILESKLDTIGSKYPFFFRNGHVHYKEFPISGLISYWMDNEELFKPLSEMYLEDVDKARRNITVVNKQREDGTLHFYNYDELKVYSQTDEELEVMDMNTDPNLSLSGVKGAQNKALIDANDNFLSKNYKTKDLVNYNLAAEKKFKLDVLEWLTNGKPKLFRSPTEGNYIVRLMDTSLTPNDTLGRMLHTFQCTAYEIDDLTYNNLSLYGFLNGGVGEDGKGGINTPLNDEPVLRFKTVKLRELAKIYKAKGYTDDDVIPVLVDEDGVETGIVAQSLYIEDCEYGDLFTIDGEPTYIGITQSYNIDNLHPIYSVTFKPSEVMALKKELDYLYEDVDSEPQVTFSYFSNFTSNTLFDNITDLYVGNEPAKQLCYNGALGNTTFANHNFIKDIDNGKIDIINYPYIAFEKAPVEEIYTVVDFNRFTDADYSTIITNFDKLFTFDRMGWGRKDKVIKVTEDKKDFSITTELGDATSPSEIVKNSPFYIFKIKPITFSFEHFDLEERINLVEVRRILFNRMLQDYHIDSTLINDYYNQPTEDMYYYFLQLENENGEKVLAQSESQYLWKYLHYRNYIDSYISGFLAQSFSVYKAVVKSSTQKPQTHYYRLLTSDAIEDEDGVTTFNNEYIIDDTAFNYYSFKDADGIEREYAIFDKYKELITDSISDKELQYYKVYEYTIDTYVAHDLIGLYYLYDFDLYDFNEDWYLTLNTDGTIKFFKGDNYSAKIYINTGYTKEIDPTDETIPYLNLEDAIQPIIFYDVDKITDLYFNYGVICSLSYNYLEKTFAFEDEDANIKEVKDNYLNAVTEYELRVNEYNDNSLKALDPTDTLYEGKNIVEYIDENYEEYVQLVNQKIEEFKEE